MASSDQVLHVLDCAVRRVDLLIVGDVVSHVDLFISDVLASSCATSKYEEDVLLPGGSRTCRKAS